MISLEDYKKDILNNLMIMSRTANGIIDISTSNTKVDSLLVSDGDIAKQIAIKNFIDTIEFCYENKNKEFKDIKELRSFIEEIALRINKGIVAEGKLYRNGGESNKFKYVKIAEIDETMDKYCGLILNEQDPIKAAALSEFYINYRGHFFSDGCGKTSMMVSAYCLMRKDVKVASYISRESYFKSEPQTYDDDVSDFNRFYNYFKSLHGVN